jgi:hypothetical protein
MKLQPEALACWQRLKSLDTILTQAVNYFIENLPMAEPAANIDALKSEFQARAIRLPSTI